MKNYHIEELVYIIEMTTDNAELNKAKTELNNRNIAAEKLKETIVKVNKIIAYENLKSEDITKETVEKHKSQFLSEAEIHDIYVVEFERYLEYKEGFRFDVWKYAIGGV